MNNVVRFDLFTPYKFPRRLTRVQKCHCYEKNKCFPDWLHLFKGFPYCKFCHIFILCICFKII